MARPCGCHRGDCQTRSSSAFAVQGLILPEAIRHTGETSWGCFVQPGGAEAIQTGCPACRTRIFCPQPARPGFLALRGGTLDDSRQSVRLMHLSTARKHSWAAIPGDARSREIQPDDPMEWVAWLLPAPT